MCLCICALIFVGCDKNADPRPEVSHFEISVTDITSSTCVLNVTRHDSEKAIYVSYARKGYVDELEGSTLSDKAIEYFKGNIDAWMEWGYSREEALADLCTNSDIVDSTLEGFNGSTSYYIIVGYVTAEGEPDGNFECYEFKTASPEPSDITFEVKVTDVQARSATISVTPSNSDPFAVVVVKNELLPADADKDYLVDYLYGLFGWIPTYSDAYSETIKTMGGTEYAILVFGCVDSAASTEITKTVFTSEPSGDPTKLSFTIACEEGSIQGFEAKFTVTPSDNTVDYFCELVNEDCTAEQFLEYENYMIGRMSELGLDREGYFEMYSSCGTDETTYTIYPGEKGKIAVLPIKNGELEFACDPIFSEVVSFPAAELGKATVDITWDKYYDGAAIRELDPYYEWFANNAVFPVTVSTTGTKCFYNVYKADGKTYSREDLIYTILSGTYAVGDDDCYVPFGTDGVIYAFAIDENGVAGPVAEKPFYFDKSGVSDPQDFIDSHSNKYYLPSPKQSPVFKSEKHQLQPHSQNSPEAFEGVHKRK